MPGLKPAMKNNVFSYLLDRKNRRLKSLAVLVDPDKTEQLNELVEQCGANPPDLFLVGGSFKGDEMTSRCIEVLRKAVAVPVVLFPGNMNQVVSEADALLLLSVISSRNPDLLIGRHVEAALRVKQSGLEIIPTGYILIESGSLTSVQYMSQSLPVPRSKPELAAATAMAGEQLGLRAIYLEAGSGADQTVPLETVVSVKSCMDGLLFVGGGITKAAQLSGIFGAGADVAVVGNALEKNPILLGQFAEARNRSTP